MSDQYIKERVEPRASRPYIEGYGIPEEAEGMLKWANMVRRLERAQNYWIATARADGRPHTVPVWGVWVDDTLYFGGGSDTRWSRNLAANPQVAVHLESGSEVLIMEGTVERISDPDHPLANEIDDAYEAKYDMRHGTPFWVLRPRVAFGWTEYPTTVTRWEFDAE